MTRIVFIHGGKQREGEHANCLSCGKEFTRRARPPAGRIKSTCCSRMCAGKMQQRRVMVSCNSCGVQVEKITTALTNSKSGLYFCGATCKQKEHRIGGRISPSHYGTSMTGTGAYWRIAADHYPVCCVDCKLSFRALLVVHHIDGNNANQDPDNLEFVCHLHHGIRHMKKVASGWKYDTAVLTPRADIQSVREEVEAGSLWS